MENPIRVSLDDKDFNVLITGGIVKKGKVEIILQDIGYLRMNELLDKATSKFFRS